MLDQDLTPSPIEEKQEKRDDVAILKEARERYEDAESRDRANRAAAKRDTEFVYVAGAQWDKKVKERWGDDPTLEFPQLKQFVNQVVNDQRQNRPGVQVHPAGARASEDVAKIIQGLVRHIEYDSQAEAVYDNGFQHSVVGGRGYWRVCSEYESPKSFNQKLKIRPVDDPQTVILDPDFSDPDGGDIGYAFVTESLGKEEFKEKYPDADAVSWSPGETTQAWYEGNEGEARIIVADYYRRVCTKRKLLLLSDGNTAWKDEMPAGVKLPEGIAVVDEREADDYTVEWFKIAGGEQVLEEYDWPGSNIPVVCCMGDVVMVDGKRVFQGLVRQAQDAQKMYNYEKSMKALLLSMAPIAPFVAAEGAIEGYEGIWKSANKARYSVLPYKNTDVNGNPIPPPQRTAFAPVPTGLAEAAQSDKDDIKSIIGMYQNSLGMHGQETSGRAILAREKQGDNATFHFADNMSRAIALTGRIIVDVIGTFYPEHRLVAIIQQDDTRELVQVNRPGTVVDPNGVVQSIVHNDLSTGQYSVTVEAGPSYATAREQTRESLMALVQADPQIMQIAGDIIVGAMDFPDKDELSERLKLMLPPPIQQYIQQKGKQPPDPQMLAQLQQMQQQGQAMQQALQALQQENQQLKSGQQAKVAQVQSDEQVALQKLALDEQIALQKIAADERIAQAKNESAQRVAEINGNTQLMIKGLESASSPIPNSLPGEESAPPSQLSPEMMMEAMQAMTGMMSKAMMAPRQMQIHTDADGNIIGGVSSPMMQ